MDARHWRNLCMLASSLAVVTITACDEASAAEIAAADAPEAIAVEPGGPDTTDVPGADSKKKPKCCFAYCENTGSYFQIGYEKSNCKHDAEEFCEFYQTFDSTVGPLVNSEWLICG